MIKKYYWVLFVIFILALFLRFYKLDSYPNGFHRDEAFFGYNSYSLLKTGRDMTGAFFPLHLRSFLYTPAGYSYLSVPFIYLFGLSEYSVRFASALFGSLTIISSYLLAVKIYKHGKFKELFGFNSYIFGLLTAIFISVSPWSINLARTASSITPVVFFISFGVYLFFEWLDRKKIIFIILSLLSIEASLSFYIAPYAFLPLLIPVMFLTFDGKYNFKNNTIKLIYLFAIIAPVVISLLSPTLSIRARSLSITNNDEVGLILEEKIREDGVENIDNFNTRVFHNKLIGLSFKFLENYSDHFSYRFLFSDKGYPDRYRVPLTGLLYITDFILVILGTFTLFKKFSWSRVFIIFWVLLSPIGSSLSQDDVPNLQRTLFIFPALSMIMSVGLLKFISLIRHKDYYKFIIVGIFIIFTYQFLFYLHEYYVHGPIYRPWYRHQGYKELVANVSRLLPVYKKSIITNRESAPAIFFLFYNRYDPLKYLEETKRKSIKDYDRENFGKFEFSQEECPLKSNDTVSSGKQGVLYVNSGLCRENDKRFNTLKKINRKDNSPVFDILSL